MSTHALFWIVADLDGYCRDCFSLNSRQHSRHVKPFSLISPGTNGQRAAKKERSGFAFIRPAAGFGLFPFPMATRALAWLEIQNSSNAFPKSPKHNFAKLS